jgi:alkylation response protein AidB-like acyl-CoA dehydrogenase
MDFNYSDEQQLLQDSASRFVREQYGFDARRALVASAGGYSSAHWSLFAELGWLALPIPEQHDGLGCGLTELGILFEQFGKGLVIEPYLPTVVLGAGMIAELGSATQQAQLLPRVATGELQLALAFAEPASRYELDVISTTARRDGADWLLNGRKCVVLNAGNADQLLVIARDAEGLARCFLVDPASAGITLHAYATIDGARAAEIELASVRLAAGAELGDAGAATQAALARVIDRATLCVCAEAVGAMAMLLAKTVEYTRTRKQFGVSLASFQALQHRMTGMFIELEQSRSILTMALMAADAGEPLARPVSAAKSRIGRAARLIGQEAIQLHGGIGVTEELDVGHYVKRLTAIENLFGNSDWHLRRFGALDERDD